MQKVRRIYFAKIVDEYFNSGKASLKNVAFFKECFTFTPLFILACNLHVYGRKLSYMKWNIGNPEDNKNV